MTRIITWFVGNPVAANLLMIILIVGGLISGSQIRQETFPPIDLGTVEVRIPYLGAAPEEVEQGVCIRVEEALEGTPQIFRMLSGSSEGNCTVTLELTAGADDIAALNEIKSRVDAISTFPAETEKPIVSLLTNRNDGLEIAIYGDTDEQTLKIIAVQMRDEIAQMDGISQVEVAYVRADEIAIEVSEQTLRRYGLTLDQIANAVRRSSLDMPGGSIQAGSGEILIRSKGQAYAGAEFEDIVVVSRADGTTIKLGDIATIIDGLEEGDLSVRFDGQPAAMVLVYQTGTEDIMIIRDQVRAYVEEARTWLPEGISLSIWRDQSADIEERIGTLRATALSGLALVLLLLSLPLQFRLAMWVAAGIPIAILGTFALFLPFGMTLNTSSVAAFLLVLGIVVDDAIVVGERVYAHERHAADQITAAISGTSEVAVPVIFGVLTTIAAFLPLIFMPGRLGGMFSVVGYVVIICLIFSVIESQLILPSHLAHRRSRSKPGRDNSFASRWRSFQDKLALQIERFAEVRYGNALERVLEFRYLALAASVGVLVVTLAFVVSGRIVFQFLPSISGDVVVARLTMPEGIPIEETIAAARQIEEAAATLADEFEDERPGQPNPIEHVLTTTGLNIAGGGPGGSARFQSPRSHLANVGISLLPTSERGNLDSDSVAERWRDLTGPIPDSVELSFSASQLSLGDAIAIQLRGREVDDLAAAAADIRAELGRFAGVQDISDTFRSGKQEVQLSLRPEAQHLGLTLDALARQVRQAFYGEEAQRVQRGTEDVRVMVRYPLAERRSLGDLEDMRIRTPDGTEVPFAAAGEFTLGQGFSTIQRIDRQRIVTVRADVNRAVTTPEAVIDSLAQDALPTVLAEYRGISYALSGEQQERNESFGGLFNLFPIALLIMFAVLAIPLKSYLQPFIIMSVIPFGAVGAIIGHVVMGWDLIISSVLGIIALSGVVVNSSLVLVDYINRLRTRGVPVYEAVKLASISRFRPILLTSITTFVGLLPLMLSNSPATAMFVPMAISLGWGVIFSMVNTLFLVPSLFLILEDWVPAKHEKTAHKNVPDGDLQASGI